MECSDKQRLFEIAIICNIINVIFDQFNAFSLDKCIHLFQLSLMAFRDIVTKF